MLAFTTLPALSDYYKHAPVACLIIWSTNGRTRVWSPRCYRRYL